jgi:uncharacterized protein YjaG (DUF416 family)
VAIHLPFAKLSPWQQIAFSAALLERMLPNYQMFSEASDFGDAKILRNQLDLIWQWLANSTVKTNAIKINVEAQLNKLEPQTPDPDEFDFFGVYSALDTCMALTALWQLMLNLQPKKPTRKTSSQELDLEDIQSISLLSYSSVNAYIELELTQGLYDDERIEQATLEQKIVEHPLMEWEKEMQNELFDFLKLAAENKRTCQLAQEMVLSEGLSNLGIEIS